MYRLSNTYSCKRYFLYIIHIVAYFTITNFSESKIILTFVVSFQKAL